MRDLVLGLEDGPRRDFLIKLMESLTVAVSMFQGGEFRYEERLTRLVGVPAEPIDAAFLASLEDRLREDLSKRGFGTGSLRDRILAWEAANDIPADQLSQTFMELQREAKARTDRMIVPTGDYSMELNPVRGVSYTARCDHFPQEDGPERGEPFHPGVPEAPCDPRDLPGPCNAEPVHPGCLQAWLGHR